MTETQLPAVKSTDYAVDWWNPTGFEEAEKMADKMAKSQLVPNQYRGKPGDIMVAWGLGAPLGLSLLSCLQHIAVINGRPSLWGDGALAVVRGHPECEMIDETFVGRPFDDDFAAVCVCKRKGQPEIVRKFTVADAKKARLWGDSKRQPWVQYPKRMLQMRARSWALRDGFADALCGMPIAEEVRDITNEVTVLDTAPEGATKTEQILAVLEAKDEPDAVEVAPQSTEKVEVDTPVESEPEAAEGRTDAPEVIVSKTPPKDESAIWEKDGKHYRFEGGSWIPAK